MNREQRRKQQRQREFEQKYWNEIQERQNKIDDQVLMCYVVCIGLALYEAYGWKRNGIEKVVHEWNKQICRFWEDGVSLESMAQELERKTGAVFEWKQG